MMRTMVLAGGLIAAFCFIPGCGARVEVAKERLLKEIDGYLGEITVQRKEVEIAIGKMAQATEQLGKNRIKCQVQAERLGKQVKAVEEKIAGVDGSLRTLRDYLTRGTTVEIAGKTYTPDKLHDMARRVMEAKKNLASEVESLKHAQATIIQVEESLAQRHEAVTSRLAAFNSQLKELDAQIVALDALKDAAKIAGAGNESLADNLQDLESKINGLHDQVQVELRWEEEKWKAMESQAEVEATDRIIPTTRGTDDTMAEIDRILGKK